MDDLQAIKGVGPATANKLQQAGYESYAQIATATASKLREKIWLSLTRSERIIESAKALLDGEQKEKTASEIADVGKGADKAANEMGREHLEEPTQATAETTEAVEEITRETQPMEEATQKEKSENTEADIVEGTEKSEDQPEEVTDKLKNVDKHQLTSQLVKIALQDADAMQQIAQALSKELAQALGKKRRKKLAKTALSKKKFRKALISELIKELEKM